MDMRALRLSRTAPAKWRVCPARTGWPDRYIYALGKRDDTVVIGKAGNIPINAF